MMLMQNFKKTLIRRRMKGTKNSQYIPWTPILFISFFSFSIPQVFAQVPPDDPKSIRYEFSIDTRYDNIGNGEKNRIQDAVRFGFFANVNELFEFIGAIESGDNFTSNWSTLRDLNGGKEGLTGPTLYFRQLYLQKSLEKWRAQFGSISPTKKNESIQGMEENGWIDGSRVEYYPDNDHVIEVVAGSIDVDELNNPDLFSRRKKLNFFEIEITRKKLDNLVFEITAEQLGEENFFQCEVSHDFNVASGKSVKANVDYIHHANNGGYAYGVSLSGDVLKMIFDAHEGGLKLDMTYSDIDPRMGVRSLLINDFYTHGPNFETKLGGKINESGNFSWFLRYNIANKNRVSLGLSLKL